ATAAAERGVERERTTSFAHLALARRLCPDVSSAAYQGRHDAPTFRQTTEAVCEGLDRARMFFGVVIKPLIHVNTKAMILYPDALAPTLVPAFLDYAQGRGIFIDPARVRSPKDKPRVENQVAFVRESWFDGEQFTSLAHARTSAEHWCREIAGTRVHGTTRKVPRDLFEAVERAEMMPPPEVLYDVPIYIEKAK